MNGAEVNLPAPERDRSARTTSDRPSSLERLLLDQLPVGVFQKDREGRYVFVNAWFCRLHGTTPEKYLGRTPEELAIARHAAEGEGIAGHRTLAEMLKEGAGHHEMIMRSGQMIEVEEAHPGAHGNVRYLLAMKGPLVGPHGALIGTQGVLCDITERKRAEAQLADERELLRALLNSSTDAIYFKDRESRFLRCSAGLAALFNRASADELIGKSDHDFFEEAHARAAAEDEQEIIRTGQPVIGKMEREAWPNGRVTWALTSKMPFYNSGGEIIGTLGISKNITEMKEAEAKVDQLHRQLLQTSREAGMAEVATSVLHNVGNVLNSVNVSATLLLEGARTSRVSSLVKAVALLNEHADDAPAFLTEDAKGKQLPGYLNLVCQELIREQQKTTAELELLRDNIEHIKEIVAMQQSYARVSGVTERVKITEVVDDALRMNTGAMTRHGVTVVREYGDASLVTLDKHKVLQILINLIRNAKYACDESGRTDKLIRVRITRHDQRIRVAVIDNGVGIPPENLSRIFSLGFTTRKHGHGFGLHSGALAAKEMGGSLTVASDGPGCGAVFTLEVPVEAAEAAMPE